MGGYGSGRWGRRATKGTTDDALRLDVRWLSRRGLIAPGVVGSLVVAWSRGGEPAGSVSVGYDAGRPGEVVLDYGIQLGDGAPWETVRERVVLDRTPCRFGGDRAWFQCPRCRERRAVLYGVGGRFRCCACHGLAYASAREGEAARHRRRAEGLRRRLGGDPGDARVPSKPKGMHRRTYDRIVFAVGEREIAALAAFSGGAKFLLDRLEDERGRAP